MVTKKCSKCNIEKSTSDFYINKNYLDGFKSECKSCVSIAGAKYYKAHINQRKLYLKLHPEQRRRTEAKYRKTHVEQRNLVIRQWQKNNKERVRIINLKASKKRYTTLKGNLNIRMSTAIYTALKSNKAGRHWEDIVGYTINDMQKDFESKFYNNMTWESFRLKRAIDIHHIKPKSNFHFKTAEDLEFKECWALSNLQPLWKKDHIALHKQRAVA